MQNGERSPSFLERVTTMKHLSRRIFLKQSASVAALGLAPTGCHFFFGKKRPPRSWFVTGPDVPELAALDCAMEEFIRPRNIPAAALAVTYQGRLVLARAYTFSNDPGDLPTEPTSLFRIASLSKSLTSAAVLRLAQEGKLTLSDKLVDLLPTAPPPGRTLDPRLPGVTVRHLLQHLGGWDRQKSFDPMFRDRKIAQTLDRSLPIAKSDIVKYMAGQPLQNTPGATCAYSNYGYCLLGCIIESLTGRSYEDYVRQTILAPLGVNDLRLGRTLPIHRLPNEVKYHSDSRQRSVFDDSSARIPSCYGGWNLENMDAHGGWLASVIGLARFAAALDDSSHCPFLSPQSIDALFALPENRPADRYKPGDHYYACGWMVRTFAPGVRNTWHTGSLPGSYTFLARWRSGINCTVFFNQRGPDYGQIDALLGQTAHAVTNWPSHDLFPQVLPSLAPPA